MKRLLPVCLAIAALLFTGCPSFGTMHTATPVEQGAVELGGSAGVGSLGGAISTGVGSDSASASVIFPYPPQFDIRYGVSDHVGIGGALGLYGSLAADVNLAPINTSNFALSFNPTVSLIPFGGAYGSSHVNILADVVKSDAATLTIGAKPGGFYGSYGGTGSGPGPTSGFLPYMGGTAGVKINASDTVALYPWFDGVYLLDTGPDVSAFTWSLFLGVRAKLGGGSNG